jgi:hypothetical protein
VKHSGFGESEIGYPTVIIVFMKEELGKPGSGPGSHLEPQFLIDNCPYVC